MIVWYINRLITKWQLRPAGQLNGSQAVAASPRSVTADNISMIQDMICSQDDAPCRIALIKALLKYNNILIEHCLAWIFFIKHYSYFCDC